MKKLFFLCTVLALGAAKPNGYYHQEYSYKSSSSSFKNNELQHKNDDQAFYSKDGDLEGRLKPKVNSQSQHSEYTNPKLTGASGKYQANGYLDGSGANYLSNTEGIFGGASRVQNAGSVDGYASSDRVLDLSNVYNTRGYSHRQGFGTSQSQSNYDGLHSGGYDRNYGYSLGANGNHYVQHGTGSYATNANLNAVMQRLQDDMTRQLEHAIHNQYRTSGYSSSASNSQMNTDIRLLEDELRRNLTRQLQDNLRTQFGSNTYTVVEGRPSTVPNYSNQELASLTRRLEDDLISRLHQSVRTTYNRESSNTYTSSGHTYRPVVVYPATTSRPYYERPMITTPNVIRYSVVPSREPISSYPGNLVVVTPNQLRYTPIPNPQSLTQIASRTQADINSYLDSALQNLYTTYLQTERSSYYTVTDFDNEVNRIKDEIIRNLTYHLEDEIRKNYGQQMLKGDYYYSISSNGDISSQHNYNLQDYENLRKQVEENLLRKLNQTTNTYRDQYTQKQQSQYRESSNTYTVTYRPTYYTSGNQLYDYSDLQRQLSQQLQNALNQRRYSQSTSYSVPTSYNPQAYQISLDELSRELQRNLTEQLGSYRAQASSSSSSSYGYASGSHGGNADFESMKNQLQNQLMQQLRQGLQNQHHYSASASYSASSSSSANANYGMGQTYGSYPSTCLHGCSAMRRKRHIRRFFSRRPGIKRGGSYSSSSYPYYPRGLSFPSHHGILSGQSSYSSHYQSSSHSKKLSSQNEEIGPSEDLGLINLGIHGTSRTELVPIEQFQDSLNQQLGTSPYNKQLGYIDQNNLEQQQSLDNFAQPLQKIQDDLTQQLSLGHKTTQEILENAEKLGNLNDLTQQLETPHHHSLPKSEAESQLPQATGRYVNKLNQYDQEEQLSSSSQTIRHHLEDQNQIEHLRKPKHNELELEGPLNSDQQTLGQQLEDQNISGHLYKPKHHDQELDSQLTLGQQVEDQNIIGNLHQPKHHDQELDSQLTLGQEVLGQQVEDQNIIGHLHQPKHDDQELDSQLTLGQEALGQQVEDQNIIGHLYQPKHHDQEPESQLTLGQQTLGQQVEDQNIIGHLRQPKHHDQELDSQLTLGQEPLGQQVENQNIIGHLHQPKHHDQDLDSQLTLGQQVEDQNIIGHLHQPKYHDQDLDNQLTLGQQVEDQNIIGHLHQPKHHDQELDSQLTLDQEPLGQQVEDQNIIGHLHQPKHHDQDLDSQLTLGQQVEDQNIIGHLHQPKNHDQELDSQLTLGQEQLGQQVEDQNIIGHLHQPKHHDEELDSQLTLGQEVLGQQVEDQNIIGQLHQPKHHDQELDSQLTLGQEALGQQVEDQNIIGHLYQPKHHDQQLESQLTLSQQELRQQEEDQNVIGHLNKPKHHDQELKNQLILGQQLEDQNIIGHLHKPKHNDQELEAELTFGQQELGQQLEDQNVIGHLHKPKHNNQELESQLTLGQQALGQQLEDQNIIGHLQKPKHKNQELEIQLTLGQQALGQQQEESTNRHLHKPKLSNQNFEQQIDDQNGKDLTQQLELEDIQNSQVLQKDLSQQLETQPRNFKTTPVPDQQLEFIQKPQQQIEDDNDLQKLEIESKPTNKYPKNTQEQQLQNQDNFDQNLELQVPERKPDPQEQQRPDSDIPEEQTTNYQELETTNDDNLRPVQKGEQNLELNGLSESSNKKSNIIPDQSSVNQQIEEDLNQQLELTDFQKLQKPINPQGDQLELQLTGTRKTNLEFTPDSALLGSELSPDTSNTGGSSQQTERTSKHHYQSSSSGNKVVTQISHYPTQVYGDYGLTNQRPFTNGHSGHLAGTTYPITDSQSNIDSYENALKQQEIFMKLLKKKVEDAHASNQDLYGHRTIKKTVFINGKAVQTQESSQLIKPNGEVLEVPVGYSPETSYAKNIYDQQGSHTSRQHNSNTQLTGYYGNTLGSTYHAPGNPTEFSGNTQWYSHGKLSEQIPLPHFGMGFQGQTETSGKTTRRVIHFVNGKPISASEKVQILRPNGQIIETEHDLPTGEFNSFSHGFSNADFGHNPYGFHIPQTDLDGQNSITSRHTFKKTAHHVNGKLVDFSSNTQDLSPKDQQREIQIASPHTIELADNFDTSPLKHSTMIHHTYGTKSTKHIEEPAY